MPLSTGRTKITARMLEGLHWYLQSEEQLFHELLDDAGLTLASVADPDGDNDFEAVVGVLEAAARRKQDDAFGAKFAAACPICSINLHHFIIVNAPTLSDAMVNRARYSRFVSDAYTVRVETDGEGTRFIWSFETPTGPRQQFTDYAAALFVKYVRTMLQEDEWTPMEVTLPHKVPENQHELKRDIGPQIIYGAPELSIRVSTAALRRTLPAANPDLYRQLRNSIDQLVGQPAPTPDILDLTRQYIVKAACYSLIDEATLATNIGISVRALQRQLAASNTTFRDLVESTRRTAALQLLHDTDLPLTEVAFLLGFSELSAFSRAARNWFGDAPSTIRRQARSRIAPVV
jgi:AraC-like DNA-binding protein